MNHRCRALAGLGEHGATLAQYAVVTALDEEPGPSNAGLARRASVTPQTMNQVPR
jgi:DNA-binding MarR family transcriptional regulator